LAPVQETFSPGTTSLKNILKKSSATALCKTGLLSLVEHSSTSNLTILALHRVVTNTEWSESLYKPMMITAGQFDSLLDMIRRNYHPVSLVTAVQQIRAGQKFRPGTVVITFDDGYLDVYQNAYPLLKAYNIPATLFITTGVIGNECKYLWWDEVDYFCRTDGWTMPELDESFSAELRTAAQLMAHLSDTRTAEIEASIRAALLGVSADERNRFIETFRASVPADGIRPPLMLSWDHVIEMSGLIEISNHTASHRLLDGLDEQEIQREILASKEQIEQVTGNECRGLAYPGGVYTPEVVDIARECGVEYAVTTRFSNNSHESDLLRLDRKDVGYLYVDNKFDPDYFKVVISVAMDWFRWTPRDNPSWVSQPAIKAHTGKSRPVPLIAHVIYQLAVGGLENGLVNVINRMPEDSYRHVIISFNACTDFRNRIKNPNVEVHVLQKRPGKDLRLYGELWRLFRQLKPDIVHTRNLATLESQLPALVAGVPYRIHGEHGRDMHDLDGTSKKYQLLRRLFRPLIHRYIALSLELERYLREQIGVPEGRISHICNGVDTEKFTPASAQAKTALPGDFSGSGKIVIGTVGRMEAVKDQITLVHAFVRLVKEYPKGRESLRLIMVGDGALREPARSILEAAGLAQTAWLPGEREDVPDLLRAMDIFVLPSLAEGISNTILEAMASGLPIVATNVGGNHELVDQDTTGFLMPRADPAALADAIRVYVDNPDLRRLHGANARKRSVDEFSIDTMVQRYQDVYDELLNTSVELAPVNLSVRK
jgi:sugar transferase (PEP-CTERM/EpsH1 system associated)